MQFTLSIQNTPDNRSALTYPRLYTVQQLKRNPIKTISRTLSIKRTVEVPKPLITVLITELNLSEFDHEQNNSSNDYC